MRYAIFSDIHGNLEAWTQVIEDIRSLQADVLVCLGDVVGYGPLPEEVLNAIRAETDLFVMGNHDAAAVGILDSSYFNPHARTVIEWTAGQLSPESHEFLRSVPLSLEGDDILFVHAEITEPARFGYITDVMEAAENFKNSQHFVTFVGHTHRPNIFALTNENRVLEYNDNNCTLTDDSRYIVNVGSVGEPRNPDDLSACYVIYDSDTRVVSFRKVQFDPERYRSQLQATTLETTPYFLTVWDYQLGASPEPEQLAIDMEAPVDTRELKFKFTESKRLEFSSIQKKTAAKAKARSRELMIVVFASIGLIAIAAGFFLWQSAKSDTPGQTIAEPAPVEPPAAAPVEASTKAVILVGYDFNAAAENWKAATVVAPGVTATPMTSPMSISFVKTVGDNSGVDAESKKFGGPKRLGAVGIAVNDAVTPSLRKAVEGKDFLAFKVAPNGGRLDLSKITFKAAKKTQGSVDRFAITDVSGKLIGKPANITKKSNLVGIYQGVSIELTGTPFETITEPTVFRIYVWGRGTTSLRGTLAAIDKVTLHGIVIPNEP